jgi:hypothetical protein
MNIFKKWWFWTAIIIIIVIFIIIVSPKSEYTNYRVEFNEPPKSNCEYHYEECTCIGNLLTQMTYPVSHKCIGIESCSQIDGPREVGDCSQ